MTQAFDFTGRTVFVAGGTSGINLGIAEAFAEAGARLAVISRSQQKVDDALQRLRAFGGEALGFAADVRNADAVTAALKATHDALGDIDVVVSGAAGNFPSSALGMSPNGFKAVVDIDLLGTFNVLRSAHAYLRKPGASVINISAPQALLPMAMQAHVCAAKAGVDMLTRVLAIEWGHDGIRVNSVIPGPVEGTEGMARHGADAGGARRRGAQRPARAARDPAGHRQRCTVPGLAIGGLHQRRGDPGRWRLERQRRRWNRGRVGAALRPVAAMFRVTIADPDSSVPSRPVVYSPSGERWGLTPFDCKTGSD